MEAFMKKFEDLKIPLEEIVIATNNFHQSNFIGGGGFGKVYKGEMSRLKEQSTVAFKRLDRKYGQGEPEFLKEITMLSLYRHGNLISLLGFCHQGGEMILAYEHASNGSLDCHLDSPKLTWSRRLNISLQAAKGLRYLHDPNGRHQRVIHRDIKSANILLDDAWNAKVSDFGLSKIGPADGQTSYLVTNITGTSGYCDPEYFDTYTLTEKSDVYSFGVMMFEVFCGRLCYTRISNDRLNIYVNLWKESYEHDKLEDIIFKDMNMKQMDPNAVKLYLHIAYQCLNASRKKRPMMAEVVTQLEIALKLQELHDLMNSETPTYEEMVQDAVPPIIYESSEELKKLLQSKGVVLKGGETWFSINHKGEHCEMVYISGCLKEISFSHFLSSTRLPKLRYYKYDNKFTAHVRAQFLSPHIKYTVNLIFRHQNGLNLPVRYQLNDEKRIFIVSDIQKREDGWFMAELYQFTSEHRVIDLKIIFEERHYELQVAGFQFQPFEESVEHNQVKEYQDVVKAASHSLVYASLQELEVLLSNGVYLNGYHTWFSLNENRERCVIISIADCLIPNNNYTPQYNSHRISRFPAGFYQTKERGFIIHVSTQFLSPLTAYTLNLVLNPGYVYRSEGEYIDLKYHLEGETNTSTVYFANPREDGLYLAELFQLNTDGNTVDLKILFNKCSKNVEVDGIMFLPLEKVDGHDQVLEDDSLQWTMSKDFYSLFCQCFMFDSVQEMFSVDKYGKKCLMLSARAIINSPYVTWRHSKKSRFEDVCLISYGDTLMIESKIKSEAVSTETTYATYLVYKLPEDESIYETPVKVSHGNGNCWYVFLARPLFQNTPVIGQKLDECPQNPSNRLKASIPKQRTDGWTEVKIWEFRSPTIARTISIDLNLRHPLGKDLQGLMIQCIELRPI